MNKEEKPFIPKEEETPLTEDDIVCIKLFKHTKLNVNDIARMFNVRYDTIEKLWNINK